MNYLETGLEVISILKGEGYSSFIVGGAVRDLILGYPLHDVDIATSAKPETIKSIFNVRDSGIKYNSVSVIYKGFIFEVTTFRKDIAYLDRRHPIYEVANTLDEDIIRRDFTINALALDQDKKIIDLVGGIKDLDLHLIRAIGKADARFKEDALRILRCLYFHAKLDFEIEEETYQALKDNAYLVQGLSFERKIQEIDKMLLTNNYFKAFKKLKETQISAYLGALSTGIELVLSQHITSCSPLFFLLLSYYFKQTEIPDIKERKRMLMIYELMKKDLLDVHTHFNYDLQDILLANNLMKVFKIKAYDEDRDFGLLRHVMVRVGHFTGEIMVVLVLTSPILPYKNDFVKVLRKKHPEITTVVLNVNDKRTSMVLGTRNITLYGKGYIVDKILGKSFRISPTAFYQVNPVQTEKLYAKAIEYAGLTGKEVVLDAYSGTGTIGIAMSDQAKEVLSVELNREAVKDAISNAKYNQVKNVRFVAADAGDFMVEMAEEQKALDVLVMDPPRSGASEAFLNATLQLAPKKIVYVSCGPDTLARDLKVLTKGGYRMQKCTIVEMFPWTEHVETVCLLHYCN